MTLTFSAFCLASVITITSIASSVASATTPAAATSSSTDSIALAEKQALQQVMQTYVDAFYAKDMEMLKKVVSEEFLESIGGEKNLKEQWKEMTIQRDRKVEDVFHFVLGQRYFVQFQIKDKAGKVVDSMGDEEWFQVRKEKNGQWKIHAKESDFAAPSGAEN